MSKQDLAQTNPTQTTSAQAQQKQHLKPCFKCLFTLIGINIAIAFGVYFMLDFGYGLSFFVAQVSAFLVVLSSFYAMKARLKKHQINPQNKMMTLKSKSLAPFLVSY